MHRDDAVEPAVGIEVTVVRGDASAIPFIMATERMAGFEGLVGRSDEAQHRAALGDGRHAYFVGLDGETPVGFAIVRDWLASDRVTLVKRIAVSGPGHGLGRALLRPEWEARRPSIRRDRAQA